MLHSKNSLGERWVGSWSPSKAMQPAGVQSTWNQGRWPCLAPVLRLPSQYSTVVSYCIVTATHFAYPGRMAAWVVLFVNNAIHCKSHQPFTVERHWTRMSAVFLPITLNTIVFFSQKLLPAQLCCTQYYSIVNDWREPCSVSHILGLYVINVTFLRPISSCFYLWQPLN